jgi:hypothetical protein
MKIFQSLSSILILSLLIIDNGFIVNGQTDCTPLDKTPMPGNLYLTFIFKWNNIKKL